MFENTLARPNTRSKEPIIPLFKVIHEKKSAVDKRIYFQTANETIARIAHEDERRNNPMNEKQTYFTDNIEPAVDFASKYYLEELGIQHLEMLMTNNASENLNLQIAELWNGVQEL
jgi:hypothetical protein